MKELSVTDVARNFSAVLDEVGLSGEEVVLVRNRRRIARLVPESSGSNALEVFGDLYRTLDDATAAELASHVAKRRATERRSRQGTLAGLRDPWAG
jgi:antitoxin (DNA-binding transcriptional repressor) of toxin-antitoxin stability system